VCPNDGHGDPQQPRALCVAIHDVAPATWPECLHLLHAVRAVADIPLSWLVVPRYHGSAQRSPACEATLDRLLAHGHELVLHGYTHLDTAPLHGSLTARLLRTSYTQREGEFAALCADDVRRHLDLGLAWFGERGWPVNGFVAPAWLLGAPAWRTLLAYPFSYTTTWARFHLLHPQRSQLAPALVYAARNRPGRAVSPALARLMTALMANAPLVRMALHPRDAHHPALVRHAQTLIEHLLRTHRPMCKAAYASQLGGGATLTSSGLPSVSRVPSKGGQS
jgi:uncharacterized protein